MFCVVGLGNPGAEYTGTRHNLGFRVADELAARYDTRIRRRDYSALTATVRIGRTEVLLMKPQTYMNRSGRSVSAACSDLEIPIERVVVVYDDVDLALGRIRVRRGGGAGGHRGVLSIIEEVGGVEFPRVKVGVGRPPEGMPVDEFVLAPLPAAEDELLESAIARAAEAAAAIVSDGVDAAMQRYNSSPAT